MTKQVAPNFNAMDSAATAALTYMKLGWEPLRLPPLQKTPAGKWKEARTWSEAEIQAEFSENSNVGIALGKRSGNLIDFDFDCREAAELAKITFDAFPSFGRPGSPHSHRIVQAELKKGRYTFELPKEVVAKIGAERTMLLEVRGDGHQTMFPPSIHPSGERVQWHIGATSVPTVEQQDLLKLCGIIAVLSTVAMAYPSVSGQRDEVSMMIAGVLVRAGLDDAMIDDLTVCVASLASDEEAEKRRGKAAATRARIDAGEGAWGLPELCSRLEIEEAESAFRKWLGITGNKSTRQSRAGRPTILVDQGNLPDEVDQAEEALISGNAGVYQRGEQLVRVSRIPKQISEEGVERPGGALVLTKVVSPWLREQFARVANWEKSTKEATKPINPPFEHAAAYIARVGEWRVPVLNGIISTPSLRADGSILQKPGFDFESGLLFDSRGVKFEPIPEAPSRDQALEAMRIFMGPFREFPFADDVARSVLLAAGLTALTRRSLRTAPMFAVDAPTANSGKTYLAQTVGIIATGHTPTLISQGKSDEEDEKRIATVLIAGDPIVLVDNCERPISGDTLCAVLTSDTWAARILGKSELARVPTNTLFLATGNNLVVAGDMSRRVLVCRLDPQTEHPDQIEHDFDPRVEAEANRPALVSAGLTILRAFIAAGRPKQTKPMGSFNEWNLIRDAVIWLGLPDPAITVERNKVEDPWKSELSQLLELWLAALGEKEVGLSDIGILAETSQSPQVNELHQALASMTRNGQFNTKSIGRLLRRHKDRIVNGRALRSTSGPSGSLLYRVEVLDRSEEAEADDGQGETEFPF